MAHTAAVPQPDMVAAMRIVPRPWPWSLLALLLAAGPAEAGDALDKTLELLDARYPTPLDGALADRAAVEGVLAWLDATQGTAGSQVLDEAAYQALQSWYRGEREGLGAEFSIVAGQGVLITELFAGGAAARSGLRLGDLVVAVDDQPFTGLPAAAIHALVKRSVGATATLDVRRDLSELKRFKVQRGPYKVAAVQVGQSDGLSIIRIKFFGQGTAEDLARALGTVEPGAAVVIDLRDNEGGSLDEVVAAASAFLATGTTVARKVGPDGSLTDLKSRAGTPFEGKVALLVNQGTQGPAEAFAAALQDNRGSSLVGTRTGGVATVPSFHRIDPDLVVQLADTGLRSPTGRAWAGTGLAPDLVVQAPSQLLVGPPGSDPPDMQRDAAIRLLSGH